MTSATFIIHTYIGCVLPVSVRTLRRDGSIPVWGSEPSSVEPVLGNEWLTPQKVEENKAVKVKS